MQGANPRSDKVLLMQGVQVDECVSCSWVILARRVRPSFRHKVQSCCTGMKAELYFPSPLPASSPTSKRPGEALPQSTISPSSYSQTAHVTGTNRVLRQTAVISSLACSTSRPETSAQRDVYTSTGEDCLCSMCPTGSRAACSPEAHNRCHHLRALARR